MTEKLDGNWTTYPKNRKIGCRLNNISETWKNLMESEQHIRITEKLDGDWTNISITEKLNWTTYQNEQLKRITKKKLETEQHIRITKKMDGDWIKNQIRRTEKLYEDWTTYWNNQKIGCNNITECTTFQNNWKDVFTLNNIIIRITEKLDRDWTT